MKVRAVVTVTVEYEITDDSRDKAYGGVSEDECLRIDKDNFEDDPVAFMDYPDARVIVTVERID